MNNGFIGLQPVPSQRFDVFCNAAGLLSCRSAFGKRQTLGGEVIMD